MRITAWGLPVQGHLFWPYHSSLSVLQSDGFQDASHVDNWLVRQPFAKHVSMRPTLKRETRSLSHRRFSVLQAVVSRLLEDSSGSSGLFYSVHSWRASPPYEPLDSCDFRALSSMTLFLVSLATAKRVGDLQALCFHVTKAGQDLFLPHLPELLRRQKQVITLSPGRSL